MDLLHPFPDNEAALRHLARHFEGKADPALVALLAQHGGRLLAEIGPDAPRARFADGRPAARWQDEAILAEIPDAARVLDLGCGSGDLLARLARERRVHVQGVELDPERVLDCIERGVPVFQADLDDGLAGFPDAGFDYVVLEETLQALRRPEAVLREMLRVGRRGIVSFPNFGYWRVRLDLAVRGRMPVTAWLPHQWYDTPNIHCLSLRDFLDTADMLGIRVLHTVVLAEGEVRPYRPGDNLRAEEVMCVCAGREGA